MKLNGLTNNLAGNDKSLSNSYLSHIVELLRTEVATLTVKENALEEITKDHIETQKEVVDTKTVNAEKINTASINDKIILTDVVNVLADLKVSGKDVLTEGAFEGPFTYKGVTAVLPENAEAGDVYITNDKVNVFNGTTWDEFILPAGTVSLAEYNADKAEILTEISNVQNDLNTTKEDLNATKVTLNEAVIGINDINTKLETKVDEAPKDDNAYVRKNGEWVDLTSADNTVKSVVGESVIGNAEEGVSINSPKVEINTPDFKVNGSELPEVGNLALTKTTVIDTDYYYEMKFGRSPFDATSSTRPMYVGYGTYNDTMAKAAPEQFTIFTKNWQWVKWGTNSEGADDAAINITAMDKDGNINLINNNYVDWIKASSTYLQNTCFFTFNQEYVPRGWDDTVYLFNPGKPYLIELKDGKFSRKIDIYNKAGGLKEQGYTPKLFSPDGSRFVGLVGGKGLRNKEINRICIVCYDTAESGGSWAIIIGGDKKSNVTDPFDPTKAIYVPLPATAYYSYACMAATDSAWYLQEEAKGRIMRITPNGQVVELNLTETVKSCAYNYIEYADKNNRPACAYYVQNSDSDSGGQYVVFIEEGENGQVNLIERKVTSDTFTPKGSQWYAQQFKFMENSHYIFFTADCGASPGGGIGYGSASMKNVLWYWDKKTHTTHAITNFYEGLTFDEHCFIEMHKTKGNAIWFPYLIQDLTAAKRTGELHFISDIDYTSINEETGKDEGEIQVQSATVGTDNSFFTASDSASVSLVRYTHALQGQPNWDKACNRNQLSATNDDGILCIMSGDLKSIALCYGDGNIKVYSVSVGSTDYCDCDADKEPYLPDEVLPNIYWKCVPTLYGLSHGWVLIARSMVENKSGLSSGTQDASYTYIGVRYRNGDPTILTTPHLNKIIRCGSNYVPQRIKWEKFAYLQTYDDYERRKKVLGEIRANIGYGSAQTGCDGWFKEVRNETKKLNLTYNGTVISSVDD